MFFSLVLSFFVVTAVVAIPLEGPAFSESVVTSHRNGENFAYAINEHQGHITHDMKPVAFGSRALGAGQVAAYPAGAYVAPVGAAPSPYYGGVAHHPVAAHHGISAYAAQPVTYSGQPLIFGHHAAAGYPQHQVQLKV